MNYDNQTQKLIYEMTLRNYSQRTIETYSSNLTRFFQFTNKHHQHLSAVDVRSYMHHLITRNLSSASANNAYSACQFYFRHVLKKPFKLQDVPRARKRKRLPVVLTKGEIRHLIEVTTNLKHRTILMIAYGSGLRVSEVVSLKLCDIDMGNMQIHIRNGKGSKDRYSILSHTALSCLRAYILVYKPTDWLFFSPRNPDKHITPRSAQRAFTNALKKSHIIKRASFHSLRHAFATHLLLDGTDLLSIKALLGHRNIHSTLVYLHLVPDRLLRVISPLDIPEIY